MLSSFLGRKAQKKWATFASRKSLQSSSAPPVPLASPTTVRRDTEDSGTRPSRSSDLSGGTPPRLHLSIDQPESTLGWRSEDFPRDGAVGSPSQGGLLANSALGIVVNDQMGSSIKILDGEVVVISLDQPAPPQAVEKLSAERASVGEEASSASPGPLTMPVDAPLLTQRSAPTSDLLAPPSRPPSRTLSACSDVTPSACSGATLTRALVVDAFAVPTDLVQSRYQSGVTRQDSTTLPNWDFDDLKGISSGAIISSDGNDPAIAALPVPLMQQSVGRFSREEIAEGDGQRDEVIPEAPLPNWKHFSGRHRQTPSVLSWIQHSRRLSGSSAPPLVGGDLATNGHTEVTSGSEIVGLAVSSLAISGEGHESNHRVSREQSRSPPPRYFPPSEHDLDMSESEYSQEEVPIPAVNISSQQSLATDYANLRHLATQPLQALSEGRPSFPDASTEREGLRMSIIPASASVPRGYPINTPDLLDIAVSMSTPLSSASTITPTTPRSRTSPATNPPCEHGITTSHPRLTSPAESSQRTFLNAPNTYDSLKPSDHQSQVPTPPRSPQMRSLHRAVSTKDRPRYLSRRRTAKGNRRTADPDSNFPPYVSQLDEALGESSVPQQISVEDAQRTSSQQTPPCEQSPASSPIPSPSPSPNDPMRLSPAGKSMNPPERDTALPNYSPPYTAGFLEDSAYLSPGGSSLIKNQPRGARLRPCPPSGPRKPSAPGPIRRAKSRSRLAASFHTMPTSSSRHSVIVAPAPIPKFQSTQIPIRGLTLEAANWTLDPPELQAIVSRSVKQWEDPLSVRLLSLDVLDNKLVSQRQILKNLNDGLKTEYKIAVRKRNALMSSLANSLGSEEFGDPPTRLIRTLEDLNELSGDMDRLSEDLYDTTHRLSQMDRLEGAHHASALGVALRKLNASFVQDMQQTTLLKQRVAELESERDEGWEKAQEMARELEAGHPERKRSSKVDMARKSSMRITEAGFRSPTSWHRSGINHTSPLTAKPPAREIPPLPDMPSRTSLGVITTDLPSYTSGFTPYTEESAVLEAQKELCEMLGIPLDEIRSRRPTRRVSISETGLSDRALRRTRHNSDIPLPAPHIGAFRY